MTTKDCGNHGPGRQERYRRLFSGLLIFLFVVLVVVLLVWAILRPTKPRFVIQDATVYAFNVSTPNLLTSNFQVTVYSRNPNDNIGVYYDRLSVYAVYRDQQITLRSTIPQTYQGHDEVNVWSPFIYGTEVPVAPFNALSLSEDQSSGSIMLLIKIEGKVRWKVGVFISGHYHLHVDCHTIIPFGSRGTGIIVGNAVKYQLAQSCKVSV